MATMTRPPRERPVVFLDIDGVLLPFGDGAPTLDSPERFPDAALAALSCIIEATAARIVLSSTWRASQGAQQVILDNFSRHGNLHIAAFPAHRYCGRRVVSAWPQP